MFSLCGVDRAIGTGDTIYVAAGAEHRFHTIDEDLELIVVFAPAERG
jgi:mannose-6-phosphate isomerase-like protein (cupin superfamily)